jgi:hypothetical protein
MSSFNIPLAIMDANPFGAVHAKARALGLCFSTGFEMKLVNREFVQLVFF